MAQQGETELCFFFYVLLDHILQETRTAPHMTPGSNCFGEQWEVVGLKDKEAESEGQLYTLWWLELKYEHGPSTFPGA
jgi:hypothetical protein